MLRSSLCGTVVLLAACAPTQQPANPPTADRELHLVALDDIPPPTDRELHVVAIHDGIIKIGDVYHTGGVAHPGKAAVRVDRPGKEVTLVLCGVGPVTWEVTATPTTKLTRVILGGGRQAAKVPAGVAVVEAFREGREGKESVYFPYTMGSPQFRPGSGRPTR
jgi:hypothetical protein